MIPSYVMALLLFSISTSLASALHGGNHFGKGKVVTGHIIISGLYDPLLCVSAACFWIFFRRKPQAVAELDYYSGKAGLEPIKKAYPPLIGSIMAMAMEWCQNNPLPEFGEKPNRRFQELVGGFILGIILGWHVVVIRAMVIYL